MEPETSTPKIGPEQGTIEYQPSVERANSLPTPEQGIDKGAERYEQVADKQAAGSDATAAVPLILPAPVVADDVPTAQPTSIGGPVVAADEDLIEKEWVDKAKKIVADTQNDPHGREVAVNQLQRDYLKKRYGRELGEAS